MTSLAPAANVIAPSLALGKAGTADGSDVTVRRGGGNSTDGVGVSTGVVVEGREEGEGTSVGDGILVNVGVAVGRCAEIVGVLPGIDVLMRGRWLSALAYNPKLTPATRTNAASPAERKARLRASSRTT